MFLLVTMLSVSVKPVSYTHLITSRTDGDGVADHLVAQKFRVLVFQAQSVVLLILAPVLQLDDHVNGLGILNALHTEQGLYILSLIHI